MFLQLKRQSKKDNPENNIPDEVLVDSFLKPEIRNSSPYLFERYTHLVYGICLGYLQDKEQGKDAVMEIFESLLISFPFTMLLFLKTGYILYPVIIA